MAQERREPAENTKQHEIPHQLQQLQPKPASQNARTLCPSEQCSPQGWSAGAESWWAGVQELGWTPDGRRLRAAACPAWLPSMPPAPSALPISGARRLLCQLPPHPLASPPSPPRRRAARPTLRQRLCHRRQRTAFRMHLPNKAHMARDTAPSHARSQPLPSEAGRLASASSFSSSSSSSFFPQPPPPAALCPIRHPLSLEHARLALSFAPSFSPLFFPLSCSDPSASCTPPSFS